MYGCPYYINRQNTNTCVYIHTKMSWFSLHHSGEYHTPKLDSIFWPLSRQSKLQVHKLRG